MRAYLMSLVSGMSLLACAAQPSGTGDEPSVGKSDSLDEADRDCQIVLREVGRKFDATGAPVMDCSVEPCAFVWEGSLEIASEQLTAGAQPAVLFHSSHEAGTWAEAAILSDIIAEHGRVRYQFQFPGGYRTERALKINLIPFARTSDGRRLFDHNRVASELDSYLLNADNGWAIADDLAICAPL